jgi:hypothetical protein
MEITFRNLENRATSDAREYMPALPVENTRAAWESFQDSLDSIDASDCAHESADSWDWVIYHGHALRLCADLPASVVGEAESAASDCGGIQAAFDSAGLAGVASQVAYWIVYRAVCDAIETARDELTELAQAQIERIEE